jgi:hypothetical protein
MRKVPPHALFVSFGCLLLFVFVCCSLRFARVLWSVAWFFGLPGFCLPCVRVVCVRFEPMSKEAKHDANAVAPAAADDVDMQVHILTRLF